jgi:predicted O-methyltransferase YrrM
LAERAAQIGGALASEKTRFPFSIARLIRHIPPGLRQAKRHPELAEHLGDGPLAWAIRQVCEADFSEQEWGGLLEAYSVMARLHGRDENIRIDYRGPSVEGLEKGSNILPVDLWASWFGVPEGYRPLLFALARQLRPKTCLELGTAPGYSGIYKAQGLVLNGEGRLHTIEGDRNAYAVGRDTLWSVRDFATFHLGPFDKVLERLLPEIPPLDLVFIDGSYAGEDEVGYADRLAEHLRPGAVVVYNGIRWGAEMPAAWEEIRTRPEVGVSLDLGDLGIVQTRGAGYDTDAYHFAAEGEMDGPDQRRLPRVGVGPERLTWIFGSPRSGTTWLRDVLATLCDAEVWEEPFVGDLFGRFYYERAQEGQLTARNFVLGDPVRAAWTRGIRRFVLEVSKGRFPMIDDRKEVIVKEPNGSVGAPLLLGALPESKVVLLVRDPRDVAASYLDGSRKGAWLHNRRSGGWIKESGLADCDPDEFVRRISEEYVLHVGNAREAYEAHEGPKALVRYEDLAADALGTAAKICARLGIPAGDEEIEQAVRQHSWENIPEGEKGSGRFYRKGRAGSWREDLSHGQARIVEEVTAPLLEEFYPRGATGRGGRSRTS